MRSFVRLPRLSGRQLRTTLGKLRAWCSFPTLLFEAKARKNDGSKGTIHEPFQFLVLCRHVILDQLFLRHRKDGFVFVRRSILGTGQGHSSSPRPSLSTLPFSPFTVSFRTEGSVLGPLRLTLVGFSFRASWMLLSFFSPLLDSIDAFGRAAPRFFAHLAFLRAKETPSLRAAAAGTMCDC